MEIHNTTEDLVIAEVNAICDSIEAEGGTKEFCTCSQCRQDAVCYVLNRTEPHYVVSHRGVARVNMDTDNQDRADLTALAYEGIKRVSQHQRPYFDHHKTPTESLKKNKPVFNVPTIMGRVFEGQSFSPVSEGSIELLRNGKLVMMKDPNWQNPFKLIANTNGAFTFWPDSIDAEQTEMRENYEFTVRINVPGFAELNHNFSIPVVSEIIVPASFSLDRTFKLPDLYLFPPGEDKNQLLLNE